LIVKRILAAVLLVAALIPAGSARAQVFGQYSGANVVAPNAHVFGAYLNVSEHVVGGLAQLRLSFYPNLDFGFQGGLSRLDPGPGTGTRTTLRVGTDLRWQVNTPTTGFPADLAVGASLGIETADQFKVITLGPSAVVSRTYGGTEGGASYVPYGGLALLFASRDAFGIEDSDISLPLRLGLEARLAPEFRLVAELQLFIADRYNDDIGFLTGVNLPF
jgi:hypothetical protein